MNRNYEQERKDTWDRYMVELYELAGQEILWREMEGSTVLISGATGMIGKCLVDLVMLRNRVSGKRAEEKKGIKVIALSRNEEKARKRLGEYWDQDLFQYVSCDVNDFIPCCGAADYVIHAASNTHPQLYSSDSVGTIASNVIGTKNLLDYGIRQGARHFCFVSSVEVYGENRGDTEKFREDYCGYLDCNTLRAGYPESKRTGESLCNAYRETYGFDFVIPRLARVYGPTMLPSDSKAVSQFVKKAAAGEDIVLKSLGNQKYSYVFVTDAAAGILYTMALGKPGEAYNVADEASDTTLKELAGHLAEIAGSKVVFELPEEEERRGYSTATKAMLDASKLEELGWRARVSMDEGLRCTVKAFSRESPEATE